MEDANNPYTAMEGYAAYDASGEEIGRVSDTVYDDVSDVLKYVVVDGHVVLANGIHVDPDEERVTVPLQRRGRQVRPGVRRGNGRL